MSSYVANFVNFSTPVESHSSYAVEDLFSFATYVVVLESIDDLLETDGPA